MKRHFLENGIVFLQLKTLGCVLFIFGSDVARHAGHTARFVLSALQNYLYPVSFFSHFIKILPKMSTFSLHPLFYEGTQIYIKNLIKQ
jgi:hypothetical protein